MSKTFLYFAYGSNLLRQRLHLQNPSAIFETIGRLNNFKLEFDYNNPNPDSVWHGAAATISNSPGDHVWGVVWTMNHSDVPNLDRQEGVDAGIYKPLIVKVETTDKRILECRTYTLLKTGYEDRRPSPQYLDVIVRGAIQHKLPDDYVDRLKSVQHNGYSGHLPIMDQINALKDL